MKLTYDKFYNYLEELNGSYIKMATLLREKIEVVEVADLARLEEIMSEEQIFLMITKGFDQNIANFRKGLDLKGETLAEIIGELPEERRDDFTELLIRLKDSLDEAKSLNDVCGELLGDKLHDVNNRLRELEKNKRQSKNSKNKSPGSSPSSFSKSI